MNSAIIGFQIQMIPSRWYINDQKDNDTIVETCFVNQEVLQNFSGIILVLNSSTISTTVTIILRYAARRKIKYREV